MNIEEVKVYIVYECQNVYIKNIIFILFFYNLICKYSKQSFKKNFNFFL